MSESTPAEQSQQSQKPPVQQNQSSAPPTFAAPAPMLSSAPPSAPPSATPSAPNATAASATLSMAGTSASLASSTTPTGVQSAAQAAPTAPATSQPTPPPPSLVRGPVAVSASPAPATIGSSAAPPPVAVASTSANPPQAPPPITPAKSAMDTLTAAAVAAKPATPTPVKPAPVSSAPAVSTVPSTVPPLGHPPLKAHAPVPPQPHRSSMVPAGPPQSHQPALPPPSSGPQQPQQQSAPPPRTIPARMPSSSSITSTPVQGSVHAPLPSPHAFHHPSPHASAHAPHATLHPSPHANIHTPTSVPNPMIPNPIHAPHTAHLPHATPPQAAHPSHPPPHAAHAGHPSHTVHAHAAPTPHATPIASTPMQMSTNVNAPVPSLSTAPIPIAHGTPGVPVPHNQPIASMSPNQPTATLPPNQPNAPVAPVASLAQAQPVAQVPPVPPNQGLSSPVGKVVESGHEHTGRWTKEEHEAFLAALQLYGKEWKKVAARVKTRTVVQTRTHAQKYFQKLQKVLEGGVVSSVGGVGGVGGAGGASGVGLGGVGGDTLVNVESGMAVGLQPGLTSASLAAMVDLGMTPSSAMKKSAQKKRGSKSGASGAGAGGVGGKAGIVGGAAGGGRASQRQSTQQARLAQQQAAAAAQAAAQQQARQQQQLQPQPGQPGQPQPQYHSPALSRSNSSASAAGAAAANAATTAAAHLMANMSSDRRLSAPPAHPTQPYQGHPHHQPHQLHQQHLPPHQQHQQHAPPAHQPHQQHPPNQPHQPHQQHIPSDAYSIPAIQHSQHGFTTTVAQTDGPSSAHGFGYPTVPSVPVVPGAPAPAQPMQHTQHTQYAQPGQPGQPGQLTEYSQQPQQPQPPQPPQYSQQTQPGQPPQYSQQHTQSTQQNHSTPSKHTSQAGHATQSTQSTNISIVAPTHEDMIQIGKFPEPSPAACGKRKMAEIAAAQMLAGVVGSMGGMGGAGMSGGGGGMGPGAGAEYGTENAEQNATTTTDGAAGYEGYGEGHGDVYDGGYEVYGEEPPKKRMSVNTVASGSAAATAGAIVAVESGGVEAMVMSEDTRATPPPPPAPGNGMVMDGAGNVLTPLHSSSGGAFGGRGSFGGGGMSLQIVNPDTLNEDGNTGFKRQWMHGQASPSTPWDGQLEALVSHVKNQEQTLDPTDPTDPTLLSTIEVNSINGNGVSAPPEPPTAGDMSALSTTLLPPPLQNPRSVLQSAVCSGYVAEVEGICVSLSAGGVGSGIGRCGDGSGVCGEASSGGVDGSSGRANDNDASSDAPTDGAAAPNAQHDPNVATNPKALTAQNSPSDSNAASAANAPPASGPNGPNDPNSKRSDVPDSNTNSTQSQPPPNPALILNEPDENGYTPLHSAAALSLLDYYSPGDGTAGSNVGNGANNTTGANGASGGDEGSGGDVAPDVLSIVRLLLNAGADVTFRDGGGNTALHWAARAGGKGVLELLLMKNCPMDAQNDMGETALHWAMRSGIRGLTSVQYLVENGARVNIFNRKYKRPLDVAAEGFPFEISEEEGRGEMGGNPWSTNTSSNPSNSPGTSNAFGASNASNNSKYSKADPKERKIARWNLLKYSSQCRTLVLHHHECLDHMAKSDHDWEVPDRIHAIMTTLTSRTTDCTPDEEQKFKPYEITISNEFERATLELLSRIHSAEYLAFVNDLSKELERRRKQQLIEETQSNSSGEGDKPRAVVPFTPMVQRKMMKDAKTKEEGHSDTSFSAGSLKAARRAAGAVQHAVDCVLVGRSRNAFCIVRPPGHHAGINGLLSDAESCGFCLFNNVAAGAMHALSDEKNRPRCERCAIVDIDAHHGNGTEEIVRKCHDSGRLLFFSVHLYDYDKPKKGSEFQYKFYPGTGLEDDVAHNVINVPIAPLWREKEVVKSVATGLSNGGGGGGSAAPVVEARQTRQKSKQQAAAAAAEASAAAAGGNDLNKSFNEGGTSKQSSVASVESDGASETRHRQHFPSSPHYPSHYMMGVGRLAYRRAIQHRLLPALRAFNPDLIIMSTGFDAARGDVGNARHYIGGTEAMGLDLEPEDYAWTARKICEVADICCQGRVVSVLEGGYGRTAPAVPMPPLFETAGGDNTPPPMPRALDKSLFSECALSHLKGLVDPYCSENEPFYSSGRKR